MSTKVKRKVTVENSKDNADHPRRPSVFERLGPGAVPVAPQSQSRTTRVEQNEKCRNWIRDGSCCYGNTCRYQHEPFPSSSGRSKSEKEIDEKDLRHKMRNKRTETKESRTGSVSPKRKESKRSRSRSRKGEHESKIKSTVVVTRPRSPAAPQAESSEKEKKKPEGSWEDDSDDWPMDATQLDYKEELTLERKRQQLQRELELELQKERMLNENVTITKTVSFSDSSSSSSSSDSGSRSSSSDSTSSSSDEDSDESSSSSSSTSSSASQAPVKKKYKKPQSKKEPVRERGGEPASRKKPLDDYDQIKSSRAAKSAWRPRSPASPDVSSKKGRDRKNVSPSRTFSPKRRGGHDSNLKAPAPQSGRKGPRTPSPPPVSRKQRQWGQSSSAESRSADVRKSRGKRHKKKKDNSKADRNRMDYAPTPPPLSSPNRTALQPHLGKKARARDDSNLRNRNRGREQSPLLLSGITGQSNSPSVRHGGHYSETDRFSDKQSQLKPSNRKTDDVNQSRGRRGNSKERPIKHSRLSSPNKDPRRLSISPVHDKYETDSVIRRVYTSPLPPVDKDDKGRRHSLSPSRRNKDRRKVQNEPDKRRDNRDMSPPRPHDNRRDNQYRNNDMHRKDDSREVKKSRDDKIKDRGPKDRNLDHDSWSEEPKKNIMRGNDSRRPAEPPLVQSNRGVDRSRDRERDRKKGKEREPLLRSVDEIERDTRQRLSPTVSRVPPDIHPHHALRDEVPRGRMYEPEIPPDDRDYGYGYVPHREPVYLDEHPLPPEFEPDLRGPPLYPPPDPVDYPPPGYPEARYRRDPPLKAVPPVPHIERIGAYGTRDISPLDPRDPVGLPVREEDYLADLPMDDRRPYEERWSRTRPIRDDWDPYPPLPPSVLPPHVVASLDEDRYGMPRRRRASPDWLMRRGEERDIPIREPRSRSPQMRRNDDVGPPNRSSWGDHPDRHGNRNNDLRQDNQQKPNSNQDDRKNRNNNRRDRRDRNKRNDEPVNEAKPTTQKEKVQLGKRPHSSSPGRKDAKKRKEDTSAADSPSIDKAVTAKKPKEDPKTETKSSSSSRKRGKTAADDDFSDWSDGDDDLLNRDDFVESESNSTDRVRSKTDDGKKEKSSKTGESASVKDNERKHKKESTKESRSRANESKSDSRNRTANKERVSASSRKSRKKSRMGKKVTKRESDLRRLLTYCTMSARPPEKSKSSEKTNTEAAKAVNGASQAAKENISLDVVTAKNDTVETEEFTTTENDEYDPISDEEFEALIEEPDDSLIKTDAKEELKIVDALDINWSTLMNEPKPDVAPNKARNRFKAAHVLSRIGFSQLLAGSTFSEKVLQFCQKQLDEEKESEQQQDVSDSKTTTTEEKKFVMEHPIAAFHVSLAQRKKERQELFNKIGASRRALCARQDLHIRKLLCRPVVSLLSSTSPSNQQSIDMDQCRQSPELKKLECSTPIVNAAC